MKAMQESSAKAASQPDNPDQIKGPDGEKKEGDQTLKRRRKRKKKRKDKSVYVTGNDFIALECFFTRRTAA